MDVALDFYPIVLVDGYLAMVIINKTAIKICVEVKKKDNLL